MIGDRTDAQLVQQAIDICRRWNGRIWDIARIEQSQLDTVSLAVQYLVAQLPKKKRDRLLPHQPKEMGRPRKPDAYPLACRMRDALDAGKRWKEARQDLNRYYRRRWDSVLEISDDTLRRKVAALRAGKLRPTFWQKSRKA